VQQQRYIVGTGHVIVHAWPAWVALQRENACGRIDTGREFEHGNAARACNARGGRVAARQHHQGFRIQIAQVKVELGGAVRRVEGGAGRGAGDREESQRHLGTVGQHDRHAVVTTDAQRVQTR